MSEQGFDVWTFGAQKGLYQPPYIARFRGRWWRTFPLSAPHGEPMLSSADAARVRALGRLPFGARRCLDNLDRTDRAFRDLPLLPLELLP